MSTVLISIVAFVLGVGVLITIHEFGHFWVARLCGVKIERFSIGFGRPLWTWHDKQGTEYVVAMLPLGGYVKMLDSRERKVTAAEVGRDFNKKPIWQRFAVVLAGPAFNFLLAILIYWALFVIGVKVMVPVVGEITPNSIAAQAGLQPRQEIIAINDTPTANWQQISVQLIAHLGDSTPMVMQTKDWDTGALKGHHLTLETLVLDDEAPNLIDSFGITPMTPEVPPVVSRVRSGEPAEQAGVQQGDQFLSVAGQTVDTWEAFIDIIKANPERALHVAVMRDESKHYLEITPRLRENPKTGAQEGFIGVNLDFSDLSGRFLRHQRFSLGEAFVRALDKTGHYIVVTLKVFGKMLTGQIGIEHLSGPVGIAKSAGETARIGLTYYLNFLALISVSLGVLNLLPIPVLDGGHLLYYTIELILRRPVPEALQILGYRLGLSILIAVMGVALYNDLLRM